MVRQVGMLFLHHATVHLATKYAQLIWHVYRYSEDAGRPIRVSLLPEFGLGYPREMVIQALDEEVELPFSSPDDSRSQLPNERIFVFQ